MWFQTKRNEMLRRRFRFEEIGIILSIPTWKIVLLLWSAILNFSNTFKKYILWISFQFRIWWYNWYNSTDFHPFFWSFVLKSSTSSLVPQLKKKETTFRKEAAKSKCCITLPWNANLGEFWWPFITTKQSCCNLENKENVLFSYKHFFYSFKNLNVSL